MALARELLRTVRTTNPRLLRTDMAVAGTLGVVGDVVCQLGIERADAQETDVRRVAANCVFNTVYCGGFLHFVFRFYPPIVCALGRRLTPLGDTLRRQVATPGKFPHVLGCALVDNAHLGLIYTPAFFLTVGPLQGHSLQSSAANLQAEWWNTYAGCCGFWLPFMCVSFAFISPARRVQAMNAANLVWCSIIDFIAHRRLH